MHLLNLLARARERLAADDQFASIVHTAVRLGLRADRERVAALMMLAVVNDLREAALTIKRRHDALPWWKRGQRKLLEEVYVELIGPAARGIDQQPATTPEPRAVEQVRP